MERVYPFSLDSAQCPPAVWCCAQVGKGGVGSGSFFLKGVGVCFKGVGGTASSVVAESKLKGESRSIRMEAFPSRGQFFT